MRCPTKQKIPANVVTVAQSRLKTFKGEHLDYPGEIDNLSDGPYNANALHTYVLLLTHFFGGLPTVHYQYGT